MLLQADGEWEPAAVTGEGNKRSQPQPRGKKDLGASRVLGDTKRYGQPRQGSVSVCASETQERSRNQQLVPPVPAGRPRELASLWVGVP